ncbi:DUF6990 domain-containing protein [Achromobacter pulmonis]|uniref:DUF6990 domain-containing protein n=1 Tax=Achromobacter pulmonis TaxID=1389932 RepID=UPI003F78C0F4
MRDSWISKGITKVGTIAADVERLNSYKNSFEKGGRLGFVPYITVDIIDRAILIAQKYAK